MFPGQNDNLILHDSGGFEAGSMAAMKEVDEFVKARKKQPKLADQLHCIWYWPRSYCCLFESHPY